MSKTNNRRDYHANQLMIEVTRRCNLTCPHCVRGDSQNVDITEDTIRKLFDTVCFASTLMFTGGEPLMVPHILEMIYAVAKEKGFSWDTFWMATNGVLLTPENFATLIKFVLGSGNMEDYFSGIRISTTEFHEQGGGGLSEIPYPFNDQQLTEKMFPFVNYTGEYEQSKYAGYAQQIVAEGRGVEVGGEKSPFTRFDIHEFQEGDTDLYITAKGEVMFGCDFSYDTADKCGIAKIEDLRKILETIDSEYTEIRGGTKDASELEEEINKKIRAAYED